MQNKYTYIYTHSHTHTQHTHTHTEYVSALEETLNSCKTNPVDSGSAQNVTVGLEDSSKIFQGLLKVLEQGNKMFQKCAETRLLKKTRKYSFTNVTAKNRYRNKIRKKSHYEHYLF